ncbi:hypothetical protein KC356_g8029 [Hortaea werneckii]|nr:hypothetical protein KC356_g8029 [Hortaea werneckii]
MAGEALLSMEEIKRHDSPDDCWIVVDGKVWDTTDFAASEHPGGGEIDTRTITPDWAKPPPSTTTKLKLHGKPPLDTVICAQDFEEIAQRTASKKTWAFYSSASTDYSTILGHDTGLPIFASPAAMAKMMHSSGEKSIARGYLDERVRQCVSNNASIPIGEIVPSVPKKKNHPFFFQLYVNKDREQSTKLLQHVRSLGVDSVFVTVDGPVQGKREADERVKADESLSTPMSGQNAKKDRRGGGIGRIMGNYIDPNFTWTDFAWLREHWKGTIVVQGVQCWQDAKKCAQLGMDRVLLSNHGGRNLDSSPPVIMTLLEC